LAQTSLFDSISRDGLEGLRKTAYQFDQLFSLVSGNPQSRLPHQTPQPRQRGRKKGGIKHPLFQDFVWELLISTKAAGGRLTLEKNYGAFGSLIDVITVLAPHLPPGFVPNPLSSFAATLQRIKTRHERIHVPVDQN
jgi:hypothetical protein